MPSPQPQEPTPPRTRQQRFEGDSLEAVIAQVRDEFGVNARIAEANKVRRGGLAGFFTKERVEVMVDVTDPARRPAPRKLTGAIAASKRAAGGGAAPGSGANGGNGLSNGNGNGQQRPAEDAPTSILDLADRVSDTEGALPPPGKPRRQRRGRGRDRGLPFEAGDTPFAAVLQHALEETPGAPEPLPTPAPEPVAAPSAEARALVACGLPTDLLPPGPVTEADLCQALTALPAPPPLPTATGSVVAVVGERAAAARVARTMAKEIGQDPGEVVLASSTRQSPTVPEHLRLGRLEHASDRRRSWRRRRTPTIVAVDNAPGTDTGGWAAALLEVLEPAVTIGIVQASTKNEDVAHWNRQLGGLDALVVERVGDTVTPAAVLSLGIPVARLDETPANAALWTAVLMDRLPE